MTSAIVIFIVASWVPLVLFARARVTPSTEPRVSFVQDMGTQPKYREQQSSEIFADGRVKLTLDPVLSWIPFFVRDPQPEK